MARITAQGNRNAEEGRGAEVGVWLQGKLRPRLGDCEAKANRKITLLAADPPPAWARRRRLPAEPEVSPGCHGRAPQEARQRRPEMEPMRRAARPQVLYPAPPRPSPAKKLFRPKHSGRSPLSSAPRFSSAFLPFLSATPCLFSSAFSVFSAVRFLSLKSRKSRKYSTFLCLAWIWTAFVLECSKPSGATHD